ncbi:putative membrane-anchored protein [Cylindrospermum stagnale PCC 7417]|uniref:Putative membrane-anchored protein n=1 Tax=Cylindrospermum stagnale PCC 7417 TaxID=56107 RepID=K9WY58_9NOST|nr:GDYXXLXY domain-containing protein [Cylindrospermum stagnale]AFZ24452.1 putative membrane-anchored protein [Cylindrospermum stagnale PCC 7417]
MKSNSPEPNKSLSPEKEFSEKLTFRDYLIATEQKANKPLPLYRLVAPLLLQIGLILAVPAQALYTDLTGKTVILQTVPVNPDNVLQGYSLNLDYNISRTSTLRRLPGWREWVRKNSQRNRQVAAGSTLYLILQEQQSFGRGIPRAWRPVRVSSDRPYSLPNNQVALKGAYEDGAINYGLENYYIPDDQRQQINNDVMQAQRTRDGRLPPIVVKVKVDPQGKAVPVSMWVRDRNYRF